MTVDFKHIPVLLRETIEGLHIQNGKRYIDATLGGGGHTFEIEKQGGIVLGIDQDQDAIKFVREKIKEEERKHITLVQGNFREIGKIAEKEGFVNSAGVLFDLGFSSYQIEKSGRGFSFLRNEALDMRMGRGAITAQEIVNTYSGEELYDIFSRFGEEPNSKKIASEIVNARKDAPIMTTFELVSIIQKINKPGSIHPATRVFQALRIAVNQELESLREGLEGSFGILGSQGRIVVISFHSLEDRIVKNYFRTLEKEKVARIVTKKPIFASDEEVRLNARSRSAKLRIVEKI